MALQIAVQRKLSQGGADGADKHTVFPQFFTVAPDLWQGHFGNIHAVGVAQLNGIHAKAFGGGELGVEIIGVFVGESGKNQLSHLNPPGSTRVLSCRFGKHDRWRQAGIPMQKALGGIGVGRFRP